jgi:hypothetical protein
VSFVDHHAALTALEQRRHGTQIELAELSQAAVTTEAMPGEDWQDIVLEKGRIICNGRRSSKHRQRDRQQFERPTPTLHR